MARLNSAEVEEDLKEIDLFPHIHKMVDCSKFKVKQAHSKSKRRYVASAIDVYPWLKDLPANDKTVPYLLS